jgi:hypothetical protein
LFRVGFASESAYQRAPDLWTHGHQHQDRSGSSSYAYPNGPSGTSRHTWQASSGESAQAGSSRFDQPVNSTVPENPRYVTTIGGYHLYLHRKVLNPGRQWWPCPLLYVSPCETCSFLEYDGGGRPQCVPLVKLKMVLDCNDAGEDLNEIKEWIRRS